MGTFPAARVTAMSTKKVNCSDYFELTRGVRQGDPLSPYLFLLAVETLAIAIRASEEIKGIVINQEETKLLQYAER